jgi:hypothetical protein
MPVMNLEAGQIVRVRSRQYLVEDVVPGLSAEEDTLVRLSCVDDDALGESLEVLWEREVDAQYINATHWDLVASRGFDDARLFSAYLHTLRWNCVTSIDPKLFQAPYRTGIEAAMPNIEGEIDELAINVRRAASANFTEAAHERNIEAGVLIADPVAARGMRAQFETLVAKNILRRVPGI